jgi:hypothetical protein
VCEGRVDLRTAQRDIAADWVAAYRKYFKTGAPLKPSTAMVSLAAFTFLRAPAGIRLSSLGAEAPAGQGARSAHTGRM